MIGFGIVRIVNLNDNMNNWIWNINEGLYFYVIVILLFVDFLDYWYWVNNVVGVGNLGVILYCGYIYDWLYFCDWLIYSCLEDDWY